jgi:hypothetical protein
MHTLQKASFSAVLISWPHLAPQNNRILPAEETFRQLLMTLNAQFLMS